MKKWYRFWKSSGPSGILEETYIDFNIDWTPEEINEEARIWASLLKGDSNYTYGCYEVKRPPNDWMEKEINRLRESIRESNKNIEEYLKQI